MGRNSVGYEINKKFLDIIKEKIGANKGNSFKDIAFEIQERKNKTTDFKNEISKLPLIFRDSIKFSRKINPKKLKFGSKIDSTNNERINLYSARRVISPEKILLNNNLAIRLIGIKTKEETFARALKFLQTKLKNQRVFMRFDNSKYDSGNNLLCCLYLKK